MILLRKRQKHLQARELAESIEDAKIFANSRQLDHTQNIMMKPISDQMSVTSNQSSVLSQKPSVTSGYSVSTQPMVSFIFNNCKHIADYLCFSFQGSVIQNPNGVPVVVQQQMLSQQELLNQQMLQMQQLQMANQQRLHQSQPVLNSAMSQQVLNPVQRQDQRPMSQQMMRPIQAPLTQQMAQQTHQQQMAQQQSAVMAQQQSAAMAQQQSAAMTQQNGSVQYVQLSNGLLMPVVSHQNSAAMAQQPQAVMTQPTAAVAPMAHQPQTKPVSTNSSKHQYSSIEETLKTDQTDNSRSAQKLQLNLSQDAGLKCSQI